MIWHTVWDISWHNGETKQKRGRNHAASRNKNRESNHPDQCISTQWNFCLRSLTYECPLNGIQRNTRSKQIERINHASSRIKTQQHSGHSMCLRRGRRLTLHGISDHREYCLNRLEIKNNNFLPTWKTASSLEHTHSPLITHERSSRQIVSTLKNKTNSWLPHNPTSTLLK